MKIIFRRDTPPDETLDLINRCQQLASGNPVTREVLIEAMRQREADELPKGWDSPPSTGERAPDQTP